MVIQLSSCLSLETLYCFRCDAHIYSSHVNSRQDALLSMASGRGRLSSRSCPLSAKRDGSTVIKLVHSFISLMLLAFLYLKGAHCQYSFDWEAHLANDSRILATPWLFQAAFEGVLPIYTPSLAFLSRFKSPYKGVGRGAGGAGFAQHAIEPPTDKKLFRRAFTILRLSRATLAGDCPWIRYDYIIKATCSFLRSAFSSRSTSFCASRSLSSAS